MEEERYQKELFDFEKPKKTRFFRLSRLFPKINFDSKFAVTLTLERFIFLSIVVIMLMVVVYAVGVERGRSAGKAAPGTMAQLSPAVSGAEKRITIVPEKTKPVLQGSVAPAPARSDLIKQIPNEGPIKEANKPFTIIAVTFIRKDTATQEVNRLKKLGFDAFIYQSDAYFQVCVGAYHDRDSVQSKAALNRVRQTYKDAYFKLR